MAEQFFITEGLENLGAVKTGGQASVYKARRIGPVITAVKLLPTPILNEDVHDKHFMAFQNEVNKLKKVNREPNPYVVKIISSGLTDTGALPFIEMEYIEGPDLEDLLKQPYDPVFTIKEAIKVAEQLSHALAHCHRVDVKHGDIKTNNVRFNTRTGNYMLLDFGMAMLSEEQRRTSLRNAGAIEFMAPEQNDGQLIFQSDVYSFGIVMFELLAGTVPFLLKDHSERARNNIMLAHLEESPPDLVSLREKAIPASWGQDRRRAEMQIPWWLINMVYTCLQKDPVNRFKDGTSLHHYITSNILLATGEMEKQLKRRELLLQEKAALQKQLGLAGTAKSLAGHTRPARAPGKQSVPNWVYVCAVIGAAAVLSWLLYNQGTINTGKNLGEYKVFAARAFFYDDADTGKRRSQYLIPSTDTIISSNEKNGFIYTEVHGGEDDKLKGWLRKSDLETLSEFSGRPGNKFRLTPVDIKMELQDAYTLLQQHQVASAVYLYQYLANKDVPEAMYYYGTLGLQQRYQGADCTRSLDLLARASGRSYAPAKATLGFLYIFADNKDILQMNGYEKCSINRNVYKGVKLLREADAGGDPVANKLLDQLQLNNLSDENR